MALPDQPVPSLPRRWPMLAGVSALFCCLYLGAGLAVDHFARSRGSQIESIERDHVADHQSLDQLRQEILNRSALLREYLATDRPERVRIELEAQQHRIEGILDRIANGGGTAESDRPGRGEALRRLRESLAADWQATGEVLAWPVEQRRARVVLSAPHLADRDQLSRLVLDVARFQRAEHTQEFARIASRRRAVRATLLAFGLSALGGALLLSFFTVSRVRRLERENAAARQELLRGQEEMRLLSSRLAEELERERKALSRELHDEIGQTLTALRLELRRLELLREKPRAFGERLSEIRGLIDGAVRSARTIAMGLRPPMLDDCGLDEALRYQARDFSSRTGIPAAVEVSGDCEPIPDTVRTALYRIAQEALTNCARHSLARHVWISLESDSRHIRLRVRDDGVGLPSTRKPGLGLISMTERAREVGGVIIFSSEPGEGFHLNVELPAVGTTA